MNEGERFKNDFSFRLSLKCRYYESEYLGNPPYPIKCCSVLLNTSRMCGLISGPNQYGCTSNTNDIACCDTFNSDCVYDSICYTDDLNTQIVQKTVNNIQLHCTLKHWCPVGFNWQETPTPHCEPVGEFCYIGTDPGYPNYCANPYTNPSASCLYGGPVSQPPGLLPYEQSCCYDFTLFTYYYYSWTDAIVYGNPSGSGFGSGE